jgi:hypothetical protein
VNLRKDHYRVAFILSQDGSYPTFCHLNVAWRKASGSLGRSWTARGTKTSAEEVGMDLPAAGRTTHSFESNVKSKRYQTKKKAKLSTTDLLALATMKNAAKRER